MSNEHDNQDQVTTPDQQAELAKEPRVVVTDECVVEEKKSDRFEDSQRIALHKVGNAQRKEFSGNYPNLKLTEDDFGIAWTAAYVDARSHHFDTNAYPEAVGTFTNTIARDDAMWRQSVDHEGERLRAGRPRFGGGGGDGIIAGERAVLRIMNGLGLGAVVQVPLWHTGIWLTLKAPGDDELLELDRRIAEEKVKLGRASSGIIFSNDSIYTTSYLVNFALRCVYDSSTRDISQEYLKSIIKITDIPSLIWGLLCSIYPNGYPLAQPCVADPSKCQHVTRELLNLTKIHWVDNRALSSEHRRHMARRTAKFTDEEIIKYQDTLPTQESREVVIGDSVKMILKVPTVALHEESGFAWVDNIVEMTDRAFAVPLRGEERESYIHNQARVTLLRKYSHWVSKIVYEEDVVEDRATIDNLLSRFSTAKGISNTLIENIVKYIDDCTVALVAIPTYNCPQCGEPAGNADRRHDDLIPLDVARIFFTLRSQRLYGRQWRNEMR